MAGSSKLVIYAALAGNTLIAITKFIAAGVTGSSAMLSEGIHSSVDTLNQALLLLGLRQASRPPDATFPFGRGKEIYFYSFVVAILIFGVGAGVSAYEGIERLTNPHPVGDPTLNYLVLALSIVFEGAAWWLALREFTKTYGRRGLLRSISRSKNPILFVVLFEDSAALLGLLVALIGVSLAHLTGDSTWDGIAAIVIGGILASTAIWLAYETHGLLIGEGANATITAGVRGMVLAEPAIQRIGELATLHMGPDYILLTVSVDFVNSLSAADAEKVTARLDESIKAAFPRIKRVFIEIQDCGTG
ncbi:MAG: cation diffusion facilitator family transporter [Proteobacteria bacterium]|nr:cation diffusion facilitator family transporter [Pseudomonadota bacterium]MBU1610683.1 cation diffusion facilitator family transporter [Pseudomonadota bacterium]